MAKFCAFCGEEVDPDSIYCLNCGKKFPERTTPSKSIPSWEKPLVQPPYARSPQAGYTPMFQPRPYHFSMKAPLTERFIANIIDKVILGIFFYVCIGLIYEIIKDSMRDGQSIGKGIMNLRVVDFRTGLPANVGQSCVRNLLCGWLDVLTCYLVMFLDTNRRRIGDHIAGSVVILDK